MTTSRMSRVIHHLRRAALASGGEEATDDDLLGRFVERRDEAAFEVLVRRHGPMVLGVCRRALGNAHDAEDAFQATFLVLVRRAASIRRRERVGNWLYGVAYRTALKARATIARRRAKERPMQDMPQPVIEPEVVGQELRLLLDQELGRLADKYRVPLVLCDLEGRPRKQVAGQLKIPEGTLSSRLATARKLLARRLTRRGLALSAGALAVRLAEGAAAAEAPVALVTSTVRAAALGSVLPATVATLTERVLKAMLFTRLKIGTLVVLLIAGVTGLGVGLLPYRAGAEQADEQSKAPQARPAPRNLDRRLADVEKQLRQLLAEVRSLRQELHGQKRSVPALGDGKVLRVKYAVAEEVARVLDKVFQAKGGPVVRLVADPRTNSLIVFAPPRVLAEVEQVLKLIDLPAAPKGRRKGSMGSGRGAAKDAQLRLDQARADVVLWQERVSWAQRMAARGYLSEAQLKADQARLKAAEAALAQARQEGEGRADESAR